MRFLSLGATLALAIACISAAPQVCSATSIGFQSQPGDAVGRGRHVYYTTPSSSIVVSASSSYINVTVNGSSQTDNWTVSVTPRVGGSLHNGIYDYAQPAYYGYNGVPGLSVTANGEGDCGGGRFELFNWQTDAAGTVISFTLEFEQHCGAGSPALFGQLIYNATGSAKTYVSVSSVVVQKGNAYQSTGFATVSLSRPINVPVQVNYATADRNARAGVDYLPEKGSLTFPAGATTAYVGIPILGNRTATLNHAFAVILSAPVNAAAGFLDGRISILDPNSPLTVLGLNGQEGDFIDGGMTSLTFETNGKFRTSTGSYSTDVSTGAPDYWSIQVGPPPGKTLGVRNYPNAGTFPSRTPGVAGIDVGGAGRGCDSTSGSFDIMEFASNGSGGLSALALDFKQVCGSGTGPALFGALRINSVLPQMSITDASVVGAHATFAVTVNPVSKTPTVVFFETLDATAQAGKDYVGKSGTLTIPAGSAGGLIAVPIKADARKGTTFLGLIASPDLPVVWNGIGAARL